MHKAGKQEHFCAALRPLRLWHRESSRSVLASNSYVDCNIILDGIYHPILALYLSLVNFELQLVLRYALYEELALAPDLCQPDGE
jgi:hypothetical protein